jgi:integrative and conjugative element protein (TIGR02256 family)
MTVLEFPELHVYLADDVITILRKFASISPAVNESGGILLGQVCENYREVLICRASIPSVQDGRSWASFRRDRRAAQHIVDYEFHNSGGRNTYLGEWHTHDADTAVPSSQDVSMIKSQLQANTVPAGLLILIVASRYEICVGVWDGHNLTSQVIGGNADAPLLD